MKNNHKISLAKVGDLIARVKIATICAGLGIVSTKLELEDIPEAEMFDPGHAFWWGVNTMGESFYSDTCRNARLLGIAFMLTMPKEFLKTNKNHKYEKRRSSRSTYSRIELIY